MTNGTNETTVVEQGSAEPKIGALRVLVETYYDVQDQRIRAAHRIRKYNEISGASESDLSGWHDEVDKRMSSSESYLKRRMQALIDGEAIWETWLKDVSGVGPCLAGGLIAWIDITRCPHVSSLWKYAGQAVVDGEQDRRRRGEKLTYNPRLKTLCWKLGESFVKTGKSYRKIYEQFRKEIEAKPCTKIHYKKGTKEVIPCFDAHVYAKAKRKTVKLFLSHLWVTWRKLRGLPVTDPYAFGILSHDRQSLIEPLRD